MKVGDGYLEWIGERAGTLVDRGLVRAHFRSADEYQGFVVDYVAERKLPEVLETYLRAWEG